jgi:hypothetical protein
MTAARQSSIFAAATFLVWGGMTACNRAPNQATDYGDSNPADANLAPAPEGTAPEAAPEAQSGYIPPTYSNGESAPVSYEQQEAPEPPPPLPEYSQPPCPGENYIWTPGYWAYSSGYYWVPGAWVVAPWVGALWTPPWWGYQNNVYVWHAGYWGPHIGFYGGIDYGFGYTGRGYSGAYWHDDRVFYNRTVTNVNVNVIHNVYNYTVPNYRPNHISFNGGRGGMEARPTPQELAVARDPRAPAVAAQVQHVREASTNRAQFAAVNHDRPAALTAERPLPTSYKSPAAHPPEAALRAAVPPPTAAQRPPAQANARPGEPPARPSAPEAQRGQAERATPQPQPQVRNEPIPRQSPAQPRPEVRNEPIPRQSPAQPRPEVRNEPTPRQSPAQPPPEVRNEPVPRQAPPKPQPQVRNEPTPRQAPPKPQPQVRNEPTPRQAPPQPRPEARPAPQARPAQSPSERRPATEDEKKR